MKKILKRTVFAMLTMISLSAFSQGVGDTAPDFTVDLDDGGTFTLSDYQGKVVMVFFFGNGCSFCFESGPLVQGLYNTYKDDPDFVAIGLDTWDSSSDVESVTNFRNSVGITFPLALNANSVKVAYSYSYDRILLIDQAGIIQRKVNTPASNDIEGSSIVIQTLLTGETVTSVENVTEQKSLVVMYPSPATDIINANFYLENSSEVQFTVADITGKTRKNVRYNLEAGKQNLVVDIAELEQGIYFYSVELDGRVEGGKIVIQ